MQNRPSPDLKSVVELKPCPFCGSDRVTVWNIRDGQQAICKDCHSNGAPAFNGPSRDTWERAVGAWNQRTLLLTQKDRLDKLEEALRPFAEAATIDEIMAGKVPDDWCRASPERRVEMMGERRRKNTENILRARQALTGSHT